MFFSIIVPSLQCYMILQKTFWYAHLLLSRIHLFFLLLLFYDSPMNRKFIHLFNISGSLKASLARFSPEVSWWAMSLFMCAGDSRCRTPNSCSPRCPLTLSFVCRSCSVCLAQWSILMARCPMKHMVRIYPGQQMEDSWSANRLSAISLGARGQLKRRLDSSLSPSLWLGLFFFRCDVWNLAE